MTWEWRNGRRMGVVWLGVLPAMAGCAGDAAVNRRGIMDTLEKQAAAWNNGDIDGYMEGYWRSPDLTFSGGGRTTRGWTATRDRYKAKYDTREKMGTLAFSDLELTPLGREHALVLGRWRLARKPADASGNFSIVLKREPGRWVMWPILHSKHRWRVIHDHSSSDEPPATQPKPPAAPAQ